MNFKLLSAALLASGVAQAATPIDGWYTSLFGGFTYYQDNVSATVGNLLFNGASYNDGYNAGGRIGYQSNPIRYEAEYTYLHASNSGFLVNWIPQTKGVDGTLSGNVIMANLYYDFPDMLPAISPYLGVGIGYSNLQTTLTSTAPFYGAYYSATLNTFAYQATMGITYNFAENYAVNLAYRYIATAESGDFGRVFQAHIANVGVIYRFDRGLYK